MTFALSRLESRFRPARHQRAEERRDIVCARERYVVVKCC